MTEDDSPSTTRPPEPPGLLERISAALLGEPVSRAQLLDVLREAQRRGLLDRDALEMIEGVLATSEMQVRDIMIPRAQMYVVDRNHTPEQYLPEVIDTGHSRFPMVDGDKDKVIGILLAKDLLRYFQMEKRRRARFNITDYLRPPVFVPESKRLNVLLREFRASRNHMAIVVDEYGGVAGLVTIEDVLEQIVGEIRDEYDIDVEDVMIVERPGREFIVKGLTPLEDFNARFGLKLDIEEVDTVGGWVAARLGRVPRRGEQFELERMKFAVLRSDSRRIHLLRVTLPPPPSSEVRA